MSSNVNSDYRLGFQLFVHKFRDEILKTPYYKGKYRYRLSNGEVSKLLGHTYPIGLSITKEDLEYDK